jgi:hypothetical protein
MPIAFKDLKGKAAKSGPDRMKFVEGLNTFRIVSPIMPGYKYWLKTREGGDIPFDCLGFDREQEKFTNVTKDYVSEFFPEKRPQWAYQCLVIDRSDNKLKLLDLKKTILSQIIDAAGKKLGDPSDPDNGWDVIVNRVKTGPKAFNVEYKLEIFDLENSPLSEEDREMVNNGQSITDIIKTPTPEEQLELLKKYVLPEEDDSSDVDDEDINELDEDEVPY